MSGTLRYRTLPGWKTKPSAQVDLNRLSAAEVDDNFIYLDNKIDNLETNVTNNINIVIDTANAAQSSADVIAQTLENEVSKLESSIANARLANANDITAVAVSVSNLSATTTTSINNVKSTVSAVNAVAKQAQATADGKASLSDFRTLQTTVEVNKARADSSISLLTSTTESHANLISNLTTAVAENSANVSQQIEAIVTDNSATLQAIDALRTTVGNNTSSIDTLSTSVNGISAQYSVSVTTDTNGVKKIAGIKLLTDSEFSSFDILADKFKISLPDGTGSKQVFLITEIDGVPTLALDGEMVVGTIKNSDNSSFINLDAVGNELFLKIGEKLSVNANGVLTTQGTVISRETCVAAGTVTFNGVLDGQLASGYYRQSGGIVPSTLRKAAKLPLLSSNGYKNSFYISTGVSDEGGYSVGGSRPGYVARVVVKRMECDGKVSKSVWCDTTLFTEQQVSKVSLGNPYDANIGNASLVIRVDVSLVMNTEAALPNSDVYLTELEWGVFKIT